MPVPSIFGVFAAGGHSSPPATFVTSSTYTPGAGPTQLVTFAGASAGQLAVVVSTFNNCATPAGWTVVSSFAWNLGYSQQVFSKILSAGDVASGVTFTYSAGNGGTIEALVYSGATVCTSVSVAQSADLDATLVIPGFIKNVASKGLITYASDRNTATGFARPTGWTNRISPFAAGFFASAAADIAPASYSNASSVTWTGFTTGAEQVGEVLELT